MGSRQTGQSIDCWTRLEHEHASFRPTCGCNWPLLAGISSTQSSSPLESRARIMWARGESASSFCQTLKLMLKEACPSWPASRHVKQMWCRRAWPCKQARFLAQALCALQVRRTFFFSRCKDSTCLLGLQGLAVPAVAKPLGSCPGGAGQLYPAKHRGIRPSIQATEGQGGGRGGGGGGRGGGGGGRKSCVTFVAMWQTTNPCQMN